MEVKQLGVGYDIISISKVYFVLESGIVKNIVAKLFFESRLPVAALDIC